MKHTVQSIKEDIMLIEQKLELYKDSCPVIISRLQYQLDDLQDELLQQIEDENNELL